MARLDAGGDHDPEALVHAPVVRALHRIIIAALVGFSAVGAVALAPLVLHLDPTVHDWAHFVIPVLWVLYAAFTAAALLLRPAPAEPDVWSRAATVDHELVGFARRVSLLMTGGWLFTMAAVLAHHHLSSPREVLVTVAIITPLTLAAWILALLAWNGWCRASLARAEHDAALRLREHWSDLARQRQAR